MTDWMECWGKARERVVKATFVGAGKEGLCPQMQNPRLRRGIFIVLENASQSWGSPFGLRIFLCGRLQQNIPLRLGAPRMQNKRLVRGILQQNIARGINQINTLKTTII